MGLIAITFPFLLYNLHIKWLGFPDGHLTGLESVIKIVFPVFSGFRVVFGILFLYFGWKFSSKIKNVILFIFALYLVMAVIFVLIFYNIGFNFENGTGG